MPKHKKQSPPSMLHAYPEKRIDTHTDTKTHFFFKQPLSSLFSSYILSFPVQLSMQKVGNNGCHTVKLDILFLDAYFHSILVCAHGKKGIQISAQASLEPVDDSLIL